MEERYLCPTNDVQPIKVGEGYSDYRLSDILSSLGFWDQWVGFDGSVAVVHAINGFGSKIFRIPPFDVANSVSSFTRVSDVIVRYRPSCSNEVLAWVDML